jgi:cytochrome c-type biogenesis protein CcmH
MNILAESSQDSNNSTDNSDSELREFYKTIRCPVCNGQSIYDSMAGPSVEIKREIKDKFNQAKSFDQIRRELTEKHGDAILMTNLSQYGLLFLWAIPFLFTMSILSIILLKRKT